MNLVAVLAIALAAALGAVPARAHVGTTLYPIYELPTSRLPDLHDGSLEDWEEVLPGATVDYREFVSLSGVGDSAPIDVDDLAYRFFLAWHGATGRLYLACERIDDVYVNAYDGNPDDLWQHDGIELMVDGDHSGGAYASEAANRDLWHVQAQQYLTLPEAPNGNQLGTIDPFGGGVALGATGLGRPATLRRCGGRRHRRCAVPSAHRALRHPLRRAAPAGPGRQPAQPPGCRPHHRLQPLRARLRRKAGRLSRLPHPRRPDRHLALRRALRRRPPRRLRRRGLRPGAGAGLGRRRRQLGPHQGRLRQQRLPGRV